MKVQDLKNQMKSDNFANLLGIEVLEVAEGYAKTKLKMTKQLYNYFGLGHGAAIYSVADVAFSYACNAQDHVKLAVALNVNINYIKKVEENDILFAEAKLISTTGRTSLTDIVITNDKDELVAKFEGLAYQKTK